MRPFWKVTSIAAAAVLTLAAGFWVRPMVEDYLSPAPKMMKTEAGTQFELGARTLVVAPHPDDETLGAGGEIEKAIAKGQQVKVVVLTSGDGYKRCVMENYNVLSPKPADYRRLGEQRHAETVAAMKHFGVKEEDVIFLGYPDGGVNGMWEENWDPDKLHLGLNGATKSPYAFAYEKEAPYCGANVVKNLTDIIRNYQPTDVMFPDPNDQHHDHWATHAFTKYVLTEQNYRGREWTYLVHRGDFPVPWMYKPNQPLKPPHALAELDTEWLVVPMSEEEKQKKKGALDRYPTQKKVMEPFLDAFVRQNELVGHYRETVLPIAPRPSDDAPLPFPDATADTFRREVEPGADLIATGAVLADGRFEIGLETKTHPHQTVDYALRTRLFRPDGVKRLDLIVRNGELREEKLASNSLPLPADAKVTINGNRIWVSLPENVLDGSSALMMSADTRQGHDSVDKSAWRSMTIKR